MFVSSSLLRWLNGWFLYDQKTAKRLEDTQICFFLLSTKPLTNVHHATIHEDDWLLNFTYTPPQHHPFEKHNQISNTIHLNNIVKWATQIQCLSPGGLFFRFFSGSGVQASSLAVMSKIFIKYKGVRKSRQFLRFLCCRCDGKKPT